MAGGGVLTPSVNSVPVVSMSSRQGGFGVNQKQMEIGAAEDESPFRVPQSPPPREHHLHAPPLPRAPSAAVSPVGP